MDFAIDELDAVIAPDEMLFDQDQAGMGLGAVECLAHGVFVEQIGRDAHTPVEISRLDHHRVA